MFSAFKKRIGNQTSALVSFEQVFHEYYGYVYRLALHLTQQPSDAEDVAQEVFIAVNNGLSGFKGESLLSTWIYRITVRIATRAMLKHKTHSHLPMKDFASNDNDLSATSSHVLVAMGKLSLEQRTLISLIAIEGLSHQQVAEILGVPLGTIGSRLHKARQRLADVLNQA